MVYSLKNSRISEAELDALLQDLQLGESVTDDTMTEEPNEIGSEHCDSESMTPIEDRRDDPRCETDTSNVLAPETERTQRPVAATTDRSNVISLVPAVPAPEQSAASPVQTPAVTPSVQSVPEGFALLADGIYEMPVSETASPIFVCTPLRVIAAFSDQQGRGWGKLVSVKSNDGRWHELPVLNADLQRRSGEVIARLADHGLELAVEKKTKERLLSFLSASKPAERRQTVNRMGWVDNSYTAFTFGHEMIGRDDVLPLAPATGIAKGLTVSGSVEGWRTNVSALCVGNPLMILSVSLAFSGPLLAPAGIAGGGLHFRGVSSSGKTTLLNLAASVWGGSELITRWRATSNGLEAIANTLNDMLLPLDEIAEIEPRPLHEAIYMLANGTGKARMTKDTTLADQARWRLALISSGEISVHEKLKETRRSAMPGHEVRLVEIESDSRAYGAFDALHGVADGAGFAQTIHRAVQMNNGAVGREFIRKLIDLNIGRDAEKVSDAVHSDADEWVALLPAAADGQIARVATRFAVIGRAGELATTFGLTGWDQGAAKDAARQAFLDWYDHRYGAKHDAAESYVKALKAFLSDNLNGLPAVGASLSGADEPVGWTDASRAYLPRTTWATIFPGAEGDQAAKTLLDMQMLLPGEEGRITRKAPRAIPGRPRLYTINNDRVMAYKAG